MILLGLEPEALGGLGRDHRDVAPHHLGERPRKLLQPGVVGVAAVVDLVVGDEVELDAAGLARLHRTGAREDLRRLQRRRRIRAGARWREDDALLDDPIPHELEAELVPSALRARTGHARGVRLLEELVGAAIEPAGEGAEQLAALHAVEERRHERLLDGDRAVGVRGIAPGLELVRRRQVPARVRRGLVLELCVVDDVRDLAQRLAELEIRRRGVDRVPGGDDERVDLALVRGRDDLGERGRAALGVEQGGLFVTHRARLEARVHRSDEGVHLRGLAGTREHHRGAAARREILGDGLDPLVALPAARETGQLPRRLGRELGVERGGQGHDLASADPQPVIGLRARDGEAALGHVEPVHPAAAAGLLLAVLRPLLLGHAMLGEVAGIGEPIGAVLEEVIVERDDDPRVAERVARLHGRTEGELGPLVDRVAIERDVRGPLRLRQGELDLLAQPGIEGRSGRAVEEAKLLAAGLLPLGQALLDLGEEALPAGVLPVALHDLAALRIVDPVSEGLFEGAGGAEARRVVGIPFDLDRATLTGGDEQTHAEAVERHAGGVVLRDAGAEIGGLTRVRQDALGRVARAARGDAARGGQAEQLQEIAARGAVHLGGADGKFATDQLGIPVRSELARLIERLVILDAAPVSRRASVRGDSGPRKPICGSSDLRKIRIQRAVL